MFNLTNDQILKMNVKNGSKVKNLVAFALKKLEV